jgi:hypothetical protein
MGSAQSSVLEICAKATVFECVVALNLGDSV